MLSHLVEHAQGVVIIRLQGRLDQAGCDILAQVIDRHASKQAHIVLDMRDVDYLSSSTIGLLVQIARDTPPAELRLALAAVQPHVRESIEISNLKKLLPIYKSVEEALPAVATPSLIDDSTLASNRTRDFLLQYLMLIQYGKLERLEDFVHIDVTIENITPNGVQNIVDIHALRVVLERIRSEGGIDIEIATIVAQPDAVSAWMIERTGPQKAISAGTPCALFAQIRGERISQLRLIRGSSLDQI
ncbi:MAG: STAS domain-containing protein [Phycisphaerales bacterium]|jgi:stage II sporulation protein AA (anti-sigma F factor antagonist)